LRQAHDYNRVLIQQYCLTFHELKCVVSTVASFQMVRQRQELSRFCCFLMS